MKKLKRKAKVKAEPIKYGGLPVLDEDAYLAQEFDFSKGRHWTPEELEENRQAIERSTGIPRAPRGRPAKAEDEKFVAISIRIDPAVLERIKKKAAKRGIGYQTLINEVLKAV